MPFLRFMTFCFWVESVLLNKIRESIREIPAFAGMTARKICVNQRNLREKMRKKIKIVLAIFLISVIFYLGYNIVTNLQQKKELAERIKTIPNFSFKKLDNTYFTQDNVSKIGAKLFIYYNSECDFCKSEVKQIYNNLEALKNVQVIFVSHEDQLAIKLFSNVNKLDTQKNIFFLEDERLTFSEIFGAKGVPYILLYNKDNALIKKFRGATRIEKVLDLLK